MRRLVNRGLSLALAILACSFSMGDRSAAAQQPGAAAKPQPPAKLWLETSLQRVFPTSPAGDRTQLNLLSARNQRLSFQANVKNEGTAPLRVECTVEGAPELSVQVRRVGYVPMEYHTPATDASELDGLGRIPGLVPDPLFPEQNALVGPFQNQSFWITVTVPADTRPGQKELKVRLTAEQGKSKEKVLLGEMQALVDVRPLTLKPRQGFPVTHWWQPDGLYDWYKIDAFGEQWWQIVEPYIKNMTSHGSNMVMVPVFHIRREIVKRPPQLLKVKQTSPGHYEFDFSGIKRFVDMAKRNGVEYFEFPHFWLYWGVRNPIHVYDEQGNLFWPTETEATGETYKTFLSQYLPALHEFLRKENLLDRSYFHLSDEPGGDEHIRNYKKARALLKELAPWIKVMDALSDIRYGKEGLTDIPIPMVNAAQAYIDAGIPHWVYYCTSPKGNYVNRFFDTPLSKIRMSGWLFYHLRAGGFLHWGYSYWYKLETDQLLDPFTMGASGVWPSIPYGDPFVVYPGEKGPIDSIRWEVFSESLQDYALLQTAGIKPNDPLLAPLKSYSEFPKNEKWIDDALNQILRK